MKNIIYITDLYYNTQGRTYYEEDLFITSKLKEHFNILIGHPNQAISYLDMSDLLVYRNTGAILGYEDYYKKFLKTVEEKKSNTFNSFDGKADMKGKDYLLELTQLNYSVIPTYDNTTEISSKNTSEKFVVKLKNGADSIGMEIVTRKELETVDCTNKIIQPFIDFEYEISFYYINNQFQYALYAPEKSKRWNLKEIKATKEDLEFADTFIEWNSLSQGITRVDACRLKDGSLLLVELEDLNPFLSIQSASEASQNKFLINLVSTIKTILK